MAHLSAEHYGTARRMAQEAAKRFPDHRRVQEAWGIFDVRNRTRVGTGGPRPSRDEEFEWLRQDRESLRGKWVALVGSELVGSADSMDELSESLKGRTFRRPPLVHRLE